MISSFQRSADELHARMLVQVMAAHEYASTTIGGNEMCADPIFFRGHDAQAVVEDYDGATAFALKQNYPNPFNPSTTITFEIADTRPEEVSLVIFDVLGRRIRTLVEGTLSPGQYSYVWNGLDDGGAPVASGLYLYRLQVDHDTATRSMTLIK